MVLVGGTIVDTGGVRTNTDILVEGNRIAKVGAGDIGHSTDMDEIDLTGRYVMPGIVDPWLQLGTRHLISSAQSLSIQLSLGTTTAHIVGLACDDGFALRRAAQEDLFPSPRVLFAGTPIDALGPENGSSTDAELSHLVSARRRIGKGADLLVVMRSARNADSDNRSEAVEDAAADLNRAVLYWDRQVDPELSHGDRVRSPSGKTFEVGTDSDHWAHIAMSDDGDSALVEAVSRVTSQPAELVGMGQEVGSIRAGYLADIVAIPIARNRPATFQGPTMVIHT